MTMPKTIDVQIEVRIGDDCGYAYVGDTRAIFCPKSRHTRAKAAMPGWGDDDIVVSTANWGHLTPRQQQVVLATLEEVYPERKVHWL